MAAPAQKAGSRTGFRTSVNKKRYHNDKLVTPVWYHGSRFGHGNYMAAAIDGVTQEDKNGKPIPFRSIGSLK